MRAHCSEKRDGTVDTFHLCDLQKSRYREKIFGPKNENTRIQFRCQKKNFFTKKRKCAYTV